jgi:ribose transport system permease protein/ribose transport system ATP-binding protein
MLQMPSRPVLSLSEVVKTFPGVVALGGVSLDVIEGEVHALVGENGAGKSTLMAVAAGALSWDSGTIQIGGQPLTEPSPALAQSLGISVVYQHTSVLDDLTVAENLLYCVPAHRRAAAESRSAWVTEQLAAVGAHFNSRTRVGDLSVAERQLVEIAKALALRPKVLVLDEPTEALTAAETERLFVQIAKIKSNGTAVVYISHRLPEVRRIADRISVLRDGRFHGTFDAAGVSEEDILSLIIGRSVDRVFPDKTTQDAGAVALLTARDVRNEILQGVALEVVPGEVVGLAGVEGNGQHEFIRALAGLAPVTGEIVVRGSAVKPSDPVSSKDHGIIYLPGDRHAEGVLLTLSVRENLTLLVLKTLARTGFVSRAREIEMVNHYVDSLAIKTPSTEATIANLSGGNQQKVLFARSMAADPVIFLADEPTRGVDAGARIELYRVVRTIAKAGAGVVVLSSDAVELAGLCDRVLVFSRGKIVRSLTGGDLTEEKITGAAIGAETQREKQEETGSARLRRFLSGDFAPVLILAALVILLGIYTTAVNDKFLSVRSVNGILFLASALAFVSIGQLIVLLTGGIDLSVGPLTGLVVVILSFFAGEEYGPWFFVLGILLALAVAAVIGFLNGFLIRIVKLSPLITTLAMFIALQGVSLMLRSTPDGFFRRSIMQTLTTHFGALPAAFILVVVTTILLELALRRTRFGMEIRAIGSNEVAAYRLGAQVNRSCIMAYVLCSLFAALGGILLSAQIGVGDPTVGQNYTLQSISAVVLGGASIFGGRGSFLGALAGVVLVQEITATTGFLGLGTAWQYWLPGILILAATAMYSRTRSASAH